MPSGAAPVLLTSAMVRLVLASGTSFALGALVGHNAFLADQASVVAAAVGGASLILAICVEMLRGGYGPVIVAELKEHRSAMDKLSASVTKLDDNIVELGVGQVLLKNSADAAHAAARRSIPGAVDSTGEHRSMR